MKCPKCGADMLALWIKVAIGALVPTFECPDCDMCGLMETCDDMLAWVHTIIMDNTPRNGPGRTEGG